MASTTTITTTRTRTLRSRPSLTRQLRGPLSSASSPNLNALYVSQSKSVPSSLSRKTSLAALNPSSLASIPDVSESYGCDTVLSESPPTMVPATPGKAPAEDIFVGDNVDVPGGMSGIVRFVGSVQGKKGTFAGIELHSNFASRGKNSGDVDGVSYFTTSTPGSGIFVPVAKASRQSSSFPMTPTANGNFKFDSQNGNNFTPPGLPKFSASIGPGARAPSPQGKRPSRTSLPRPDSPVRRTQMTPGPRPSIGTPAPKVPARYGSPTNNNRFTQSVRGTAGDPNKKTPRFDRKPSIGPPRSASALGSASGFDDETPPSLPASPQRARPNGLSNSVSVMNLRRPASRAAAANEEEIERLRSQLEDRDRQLKEQSSTLAEMESSLVELQSLIGDPDVTKLHRPNSLDDKDSAQLRHMLREKNDKIAMLTAEFDAHRADFRSTIDTLELASTETERVYEKRIEELMGDIRELEGRNLDVDSVASQLRQLEELVQELEEGLEDARRGEAEARGEAEFLRGEVERTKTELRREREKFGSELSAHAESGSLSKKLEQKEDEIRGLKAIIHSLSRDSITDSEERTPTTQHAVPFKNGGEDSGRMSRDNLEQQIVELQAVLDKKNTRQEELERELEAAQAGSQTMQNGSTHRSSLRDSRDTVMPVRANEPRSPDANHKRAPLHRRGNTLDTMHESDTYSNATELSTLWCEICETSGHDILTCTNMFGPEGAKTTSEPKSAKDDDRNGQKAHKSPVMDDAHPAPLSPVKGKANTATSAVKILPNPMESGPVAGKDSGVVDPGKWCAVCERDGHDSVDCPFEGAF